jgi:hypothetical protein
MLFLHAKNNMARKPQGLAYRLLQTIVCDDIVASYVDWEDAPVTISADKALGAAESTGSRTTKEEAADFLRAVLAQGEVPAGEVQQAARKAGITPKPLRVAREALKITSRREGFGPGAVWNWSLPGPSIDALTPIDAQPRDGASMDPEGIYGGKDTGLPPRARLREPAVNGAEHSEPTATAPSDDPIPEVLRRCDHCGQPATAADPMSPYDWQGRPDGVRLHRECEARWFDSHKPAPGSAFDPAPRQPASSSPVCAVCKEPEPPPNQVAIDGLNVWLHRGCEVEFSGRLDRGGGPDVPQPTLAEPPAQTNGGAVEKPPDAVADVPAQAEPPAAAVINEAEKAKQEAVAETAQTPPSVTGSSSEAAGFRDCAVCGDDLYRCFPLKCPIRQRASPH